MSNRCNCQSCVDDRIAARRERHPDPPRGGHHPTRHGRKAREALPPGFIDRIDTSRQTKRMAAAPDEGTPWRVTRPTP